MSASRRGRDRDTGRGVSHYIARFDDFAPRLEASSPAWLRMLRAQALRCFSELGFPTTRAEAWRYTDMSTIAEAELELAAPAAAGLPRRDVDPFLLMGGAATTAVFVNGHFSPELSPNVHARGGGGGIRVESIARLRATDDPRLKLQLAQGPDLKQHAFAALNTAFLDDGAMVFVPRGRTASEPVHLLFISTADAARPGVCHPRVGIGLEAESRAVVIEDHVCLGSSQHLSNSVTAVSVGERARLDLVVLERGAAFHVSNLHSRQEGDSLLRCHTLTLGGELVRNDLTCVLEAPGAECELYGLFLGAGGQLVDNHTLVDHAVPHGSSRQLYKGILGGRSKGVFRGRVIVRPDAQKTSAVQSNPNLLLTRGAEVNSKPQLEIYADDVKCSHGSTVGRVDPEALFFLRSRGIAEARAREMLTRGFAEEVTVALPSADLSRAVTELVAKRIRGGAADPGEAA